MRKFKLSVLFMGIFVILVFGISLFFFVRGDPRSGVSGLFVDSLNNLPFEMNLSLIAFIGQWAILLLIVVLGYLKFLKHRKEEEEKVKSFIIPTTLPKSKTNLDVFYDLIKQNKILSLGIISKLFNLSKEKSLEWARILEDKDLVTIEYPAFSEPEVRLRGYKEEKEEMAKEIAQNPINLANTKEVKNVEPEEQK